VKEKKKIP
jgi:hypothetical protein